MRSKNYSGIIEIQVPCRFYWDKDGDYDGFEFGSLGGCSRHELRLLQKVIDQLFFDRNSAHIVEYLNDNHKIEWQLMLDQITNEKANIPQAFIDAFKKDGGRP
jgi:hypothetical protein